MKRYTIEVTVTQVGDFFDATAVVAHVDGDAIIARRFESQSRNKTWAASHVLTEVARAFERGDLT